MFLTSRNGGKIINRKTGNKKTAVVKTAVDTVANEMLAAQRKEGERQFSGRKARNFDANEDFDYSSLNWATDLGIITAKDRAIFERTINNEIYRGMKPQSANGEYIIDTGRCLMFTDGDFHAPTLSRVVEFATEYESLTADAKEMLIDEAKTAGDLQKSISAIEKMFGSGFVSLYDRPDGNSYGGKNRRGKGTNRSRTHQTAKSLKERLAEEGLEYLLDDEGELSGIQNQERSTGGLSKREILANAFEEVAQTPYERSRIREDSC